MSNEQAESYNIDFALQEIVKSIKTPFGAEEVIGMESNVDELFG